MPVCGLDVFENEPTVPAALMALDNVVLTPHTASATHETRRAMADLVLENLESFFAAGAVRTPVPNPGAWPATAPCVALRPSRGGLGAAQRVTSGRARCP